MANSKITDLTSGGAAQPTDEIPINRSGADRKLIVSNLTRERLSADRTYYVRSDGSDSNTGLVNSAGGAFLTIQKACDVICNDIDPNGYQVTVNIGAGSFAGFTFYNPEPTTNRSKTIILFVGDSKTTTHITSATYLQHVWVKFSAIDFQLVVWCDPFTQAIFFNTKWSVFGNLYITPFCNISFQNQTTIATDSSMFYFVFFDGGPSQIIWDGTVVLEDTPAWSQAFIYMDGAGAQTGGGNTVQWAVTSVSGVAATGSRASLGYNQYLVPFGSGVLSDIPGDSGPTYNKFHVLPSTTGTVFQFTSAGTYNTTLTHTSATFADELVWEGANFFIGLPTNAGACEFGVNCNQAVADAITFRDRADAFLFPNNQFHAEATNGTNSSCNIGLIKWSANATPPRLMFGKSRSNAQGTHTVVQSGDSLGEILFNGSDATDFTCGAAIRAVVDSTPGSNDMPTALILSVVADGGNTATDRVTLKNDGGVIVGTGTTSPGAGGLIVEGKAATPLKSGLTIATGAITVTGSYHTIDTESAAASDDLDTINGGIDGMRLVIRAVDSAHTVVAKDGTGNLQLAGDCTLDNAQDTLELIYDSALSAWLELGRSDNGA